jgi:hypothetical protein
MFYSLGAHQKTKQWIARAANGAPISVTFGATASGIARAPPDVCRTADLESKNWTKTIKCDSYGRLVHLSSLLASRLSCRLARRRVARRRVARRRLARRQSAFGIRQI